MILYLLERLWIELKQALATGTVTADNACVLQNSQVLGDGLTREPGAFGQLRDGDGLSLGEPRNQQKPGLVAQRGEDRRMRMMPGRLTAGVSERHGSGCFSSVLTILRRSCGTIQGGDRSESYRSRTR